MEYRFRAKKSWNIPSKVYGIFWLGLIVSNFFPRNVDEYRWIVLSLIFLGFICIGLCFRALSQKIILTITDSGISYSGNDYIFAPKLENIAAERLSKILIPDYEPIDFNEGWLKPRVCLLDQQGKLIRDLDLKQWQPLDDLDLEQALKTCLRDKIELANRSKMLEMVNKYQQEVVNPDVGKVAGYFAYSSVGLVLICIALAFLDTNITIAWG